jgi:hypothetical protein
MTSLSVTLPAQTKDGIEVSAVECRDFGYSESFSLR